MKKVLIIGGCGYIGSALYNFLQADYVVDTVDLEWYGNFINKNNNMVDFNTLSKEEIQKYNAVILLAGHSSVKMCEDNMVSVLKNNVVNFVELINKINKKQIFIYASSSSVYGDTKQREVAEDFIQFTPNNCYDLSKYEIDAYAALMDKKYFALRLGTVNGPSPNLRSDIMINAMTFNALKNNKVFCFNPEIHRPILGINDLCRAMGALLKRGTYENRGVYNLASFNSTARSISQEVARCTEAELEIVESIPDVVTNVKLQTKAYDFLINTSKFEKEFGFKFKDTIENIVFTIMENFDTMNKGSRSDAKLY